MRLCVDIYYYRKESSKVGARFGDLLFKSENEDYLSLLRCAESRQVQKTNIIIIWKGHNYTEWPQVQALIIISSCDRKIKA